MRYLKNFYHLNESLNFNPRIISESEFENMISSSIALRFSSEDTAKLLVNSRGVDISWNYPKLLRYNIFGYFSNNPNDEIEIKFVTEFKLKRFTDDDDDFVYFEINFGYRNKKTDWREYINLPTDKKIQGVMSMDEFDSLLENPKVWKDYCITQTNKQIEF